MCVYVCVARVCITLSPYIYGDKSVNYTIYFRSRIQLFLVLILLLGFQFPFYLTFIKVTRSTFIKNDWDVHLFPLSSSFPHGPSTSSSLKSLSPSSVSPSPWLSPHSGVELRTTVVVETQEPVERWRLSKSKDQHSWFIISYLTIYHIPLVSHSRFRETGDVLWKGFRVPNILTGVLNSTTFLEEGTSGNPLSKFLRVCWSL